MLNRKTHTQPRTMWIFWQNNFGRVRVSGKGMELSLWVMVIALTGIFSCRVLHGIAGYCRVLLTGILSCRVLLPGSLGNWIPMREQHGSVAIISENEEMEKRSCRVREKVISQSSPQWFRAISISSCSEYVDPTTSMITLQMNFDWPSTRETWSIHIYQSWFNLYQEMPGRVTLNLSGRNVKLLWWALF